MNIRDIGAWNLHYTGAARLRCADCDATDCIKASLTGGQLLDDDFQARLQTTDSTAADVMAVPLVVGFPTICMQIGIPRRQSG